MKKVVELTFPEELKHEPILYRSIKDYQIIITVIEASFSSDVGWALLSLDGDEEEMVKILNYWKDSNITVDIRKEE